MHIMHTLFAIQSSKVAKIFKITGNAKGKKTKEKETSHHLQFHQYHRRRLAHNNAGQPETRKKFFYALTGDGINEKDLDSGKIQGRLKANKKGTAVIKHIFSEDNRNEGVETFTLKVFKNKKQTRKIN